MVAASVCVTMSCLASGTLGSGPVREELALSAGNGIRLVSFNRARPGLKAEKAT